jgi:hypothetical protein
MDDPTLLVRPFPHRGEGMQGYLLRLAEANYLTVRELKGLGIQFDLETLRRNSLLPNEALDPALFAYVDRMSSLADRTGRSMNRQAARCCPKCLDEQPHWQAPWEFLFFDACPYHGTWLVDQCSSCGTVLRWDREHLLRCVCGADLRTETSRQCPESVRRLSVTLVSAILGQAEPTDLDLAVLRGMGVEEIQRLVRFLGSYFDPGAGLRPLKRHRAGQMASSWPVSSLAAEVLLNWPDAFHASLSRMQGPVGEEKTGLRGFLHHANYYFYHGLQGIAFDWVRNAFEVWLAENWKGGLNKRNRRLTEEILAKVQWVPGGVAAETLGVSIARLRNLIREGKIDGQESVSVKGRRFLAVRRDQLEQLNVQLASEMTMQSAMEALGLGKMRLQRILKLLFPTARRIYDRVYLPWCVPRSEVEALAALGSHLPVVGVPDESQVSLAYVLRYWNLSVDEIVGLVEAVKVGTIAPSALLDGAKGISRWILEVSQLRAWRLKQSAGRRNWVSIPEMSQILDVKQQVAYWLTHHGYIPIEHFGGCTGLGARIRMDDLDDFRRKYVFGRDIAAIVGRSPKKVMRMLAAHGIYPLRGSNGEPCRQLVYDRADEIQRFLSQVTGRTPGEFGLVKSPGIEADAR